MKQSVTTFDEFVRNAFTSRNFFDYKKGPEPFFSPECQKAIMDHYIAETSAVQASEKGKISKWQGGFGDYRSPLDGVRLVSADNAAAKPSAPQGAVCTKCNGRNEYAEPSSSYICYECR